MTGAARGIGAAVARRFLEEGASVFLADVRAAGAGGVPEGARAWFVHLDVTRESDWAAALAEVRGRAGRLEVLVNNAGVNIRESIERMSGADLDTMLTASQPGRPAQPGWPRRGLTPPLRA